MILFARLQEQKQDKFIVLAMNNQTPNMASMIAKQTHLKQAQVKALQAKVAALQVMIVSIRIHAQDCCHLLVFLFR